MTGALDLLALLLCRTPHATVRELSSRAVLQTQLNRLLSMGLEIQKADCDEVHFLALREVRADWPSLVSFLLRGCRLGFLRLASSTLRVLA